MCRVFWIDLRNPITINGLKDIGINRIMIMNNFSCDDFYTPADGDYDIESRNRCRGSSVSSSSDSVSVHSTSKTKTNSKSDSKSNRLFQYNHAEICTYCYSWMEYAPRNTYTEQFERVLMLLNQDEEVKQRIVEDCQTDGCFLHVEITYDNRYANFPTKSTLEMKLSDFLLNMDDVDITLFQDIISARQNRARSYRTEMKDEKKTLNNEKSINEKSIVDRCICQ
jgi:hypothetical protein